MDDFLRYFEDPKFIHWIYNPDKELNDYWDNWFRIHPEEKKEAEFARLVLIQLRSRKEKEDRKEVISLYTGIAQKISNPNLRSRSLLLFFPLMRYAAIGLIFLSLGVLLTYKYSHNKNIAKEQITTPRQDNSDAQLILSDGRKIALNSKESRIEYRAGGKIVINQKDTIESNSALSEVAMNELIIPYGKNSSVQLSDGTVAYINAGSTLTYPLVFKGNIREVSLIGEGYFEVAHIPGQSFVVKTKDLNITAVGTIFNISAYPADKIVETVLLSGKVVLHNNILNESKKDVILKPNDLASYDRETHITTSRQVDASLYVAWHEGILNFQSTALSNIILKLERYYNIRVLLDNQILGTRSITGKLMLKDDKEGVLEVLASTARLELKKTDNNVYCFK